MTVIKLRRQRSQVGSFVVESFVVHQMFVIFTCCCCGTCVKMTYKGGVHHRKKLQYNKLFCSVCFDSLSL